MKSVMFYHLDTGILRPSHFTTSDDSLVELNIPDNHAAIEGHHDHLSRRVDLAAGIVVDYQPPQPSADHEWNADIRRWQLTAAAQAKADAREAALARIAFLEGAPSRRAAREHALGYDGALARLKTIDDEIIALRQKL